MAKINVRDRNRNSPDKKPNWEYRFEAAKIDGKRKHISKAGFRTKKEALEAGAKALAEYNNAGAHFEPSEISLSDYLDLWYKQYCVINLKYNTQIGYLGLIDNHFKPYLGSYKLRSISPFIIQDFINQVSLNGYSRSHIKGMLATLQAAFDYAIHPLGLIKENPCRFVKLPLNLKKKRERVIITEDDFKAIIARFPFGNRFHIPLMLGWYCGLRISETFGLTWDDIDFENRTVSINKQIIKRNFAIDPRFTIQFKGLKEEKCGWYFTEPKYNSHRVIKIGTTLLEALKKEKERQARNEEIYGDYFTYYTTKTEKDEKGEEITRIIPVSKSLPASLPRVNLICIDENGGYTSTDSFKYAARVIHYELHLPIGYHSLRHSHATLLIQAGVSPKAVQQRLGHRRIETTLDTYVHTTEDMQDAAVEAFENLFLDTQ